MFGLKPNPKKLVKKAEEKYKEIIKLEEQKIDSKKKIDEKIKKLKEEIVNMGKLTLKDGKIVDESVQQKTYQSPQGVPKPIVPQQPVQNDYPQEEVYTPPQFQRPPMPPQYQQQMPPQYQQEVPPEYRQQAPPQYQQEVPPEYRQQAPPQQQHVIGVNIYLSTDRIIDIDVMSGDFDDFLGKLKDCIDTQSYFDLEDGRGFNGRYVVYVEYGNRK